MALETLIGKEPKLALLTVERRPIVDHFRVNFDFVYPLHVIAQLFQVFDVTVADLANDERIFGIRVAGLGGGGRGGRRASREWRNRNARRIRGLLLCGGLLLGGL